MRGKRVFWYVWFCKFGTFGFVDYKQHIFKTMMTAIQLQRLRFTLLRVETPQLQKLVNQSFLKIKNPTP